MSSLSIPEKSKLETVFRMGGGYVLDFSDRTLQSFMADSAGIDIHDDKYKPNSGSASKANRLRTFWNVAPDHLVGKAIVDMLSSVTEYWDRKAVLGESMPANEERAYEESRQIAERLLRGLEAEHLDTLQGVAIDENFTLLAKQIKTNIENDEPEAGLDRLHTFVIKYFRQLCEKHGIAYSKEETLNGVFGKYFRFLKASGKIESEMSENILKYSANLLSSFNYVRNNRSLAHDNIMLNSHESMLIFRNVSALIKFVDVTENP